MNSERTSATLGEIIDLVIDHRGLTPKKMGGNWSDSGYRVLSAKNVKTGKIIEEDKIRKISAEMYDRWMKEPVEREDIFITSEAPFGEVLLWDSEEKIVLGQRLFGLRCNKSHYPKYIYYYMTSKAFQNELKSRSTGTTVTGLRQPELLKCSIELPCFTQQKIIGDYLYNLESLISCNQHINDYLLQICESIFDTVYANSTSSVLLSELVDVCYGKDHKKLADGTIPTYGSGGIIRYVEKALYADGESVLIPRKGTLNNVIYTSEPFWSVDTMFYTKMKKMNVAKYVYFFMKKQDLSNKNTGSAIPSMTADILNAIELNVPTEKQIIEFDESIQPMFNQILKNKKQNTLLTSIRDSLLPKLMSGEIDVSELDLGS